METCADKSWYALPDVPVCRQHEPVQSVVGHVSTVVSSVRVPIAFTNTFTKQNQAFQRRSLEFDNAPVYD